jgi:ankyrin repeat protein
VDVFEAIRAGDLERVRELASHATERNENGISAVLLARYYGRDDMVDELMPADDKLDVFEAAALGRAERVQELVEVEPELARAWSPDGYTPLHFAAFCGYPEIVEILLRQDADVEAVARNEMRVRPLHSAAAGPRAAEVARLLLDAGADPAAEGEGGHTALDEARSKGDAELEQLLAGRLGVAQPAEGPE